MLKASMEIQAQWWSDSTAKNTAAWPPGQDSRSQWRPISQVSWPFYFRIFIFFSLLFHFTILFLTIKVSGVFFMWTFYRITRMSFFCLFTLDLQSVNVKIIYSPWKRVLNFKLWFNIKLWYEFFFSRSLRNWHYM